MVKRRSELSAQCKKHSCQRSKICTKENKFHDDTSLQLDATGIHIVELAKTAPLGKRASHLSTIMVDINLHLHCRVILNFVQKFPGYDFKNSNPPDPLDHYGQTYVCRSAKSFTYCSENHLFATAERLSFQIGC
jgi:hypothetical protein